MKAFSEFFAGGAALAACALTSPAEAQYYSPPGYGAPGDPRSYGYPLPGERATSEAAINQCVAATEARLEGRYGAFDGPRGRVLGISRVQPREGGGLTVRGVARTADYRAYGYPSRGPNLVWTCKTDFRGFITGLRLEPARQNFTYDYRPWSNDYSQYGYQRY